MAALCGSGRGAGEGMQLSAITTWWIPGTPLPITTSRTRRRTSTGPLPDGSIFNQFVDTSLIDGSLRVGTIPILDWVPKDRGRECSYSVAMYGPQQMVDPYDTDCGNG